MGNIGPRSWQYGPSAARSVQKRLRANISPVRLEQARLVSSLLYGTRVMLVSKLPAFENKKYTSLTISMETVRMAKSRPRKNQSECPDLPQDYLAI